MKRSLLSAGLALAPFAVLFVLLNAGIDDFFGRFAAASQVAEFMVKYWWVMVGLALVAHALCYVVAALRNRAMPVWRRVLWSVAMVLGIPFIVPVYWWFHSEPTTSVNA